MKLLTPVSVAQFRAPFVRQKRQVFTDEYRIVVSHGQGGYPTSVDVFVDHGGLGGEYGAGGYGDGGYGEAGGLSSDTGAGLMSSGVYVVKYIDENEFVVLLPENRTGFVVWEV
jgi:hypothetical protein